MLRFMMWEMVTAIDRENNYTDHDQRTPQGFNMDSPGFNPGMNVRQYGNDQELAECWYMLSRITER